MGWFCGLVSGCCSVTVRGLVLAITSVGLDGSDDVEGLGNCSFSWTRDRDLGPPVGSAGLLGLEETETPDRSLAGGLGTSTPAWFFFSWIGRVGEMKYMS